VTSDNINWLRTFPVQRFVGDLHMVHAGWTDPIDEYLWEPNEEYFEKIPGKIFLSGHTHIQSLHEFGDKTYCNPGSVGQPRDNDPRAAYAIFENEMITLHRTEYDMEKVFELMKKAGFDDYYYGSLKTGARRLCKLP
jgi:diadenosine tetraphosphatase ApaH/serine/threonine PP2A family protein phosphatase